MTSQVFTSMQMECTLKRSSNSTVQICIMSSASFFSLYIKKNKKKNNPDFLFFCESTGLLSSHYEAKTNAPCNNLSQAFNEGRRMKAGGIKRQSKPSDLLEEH